MHDFQLLQGAEYYCTLQDSFEIQTVRDECATPLCLCSRLSGYSSVFKQMLCIILLYCVLEMLSYKLQKVDCAKGKIGKLLSVNSVCALNCTVSCVI